MKGIVFTEFLDLIEQKFGYEMVDGIISDSHLASGGSYTSVGTYAHSEMVQLVTHLSERSGVPAADLLKLYGKHLFGIFAQDYGIFFKDINSSFDLLNNIERYIHIEVKKLYPDAELPHFKITQLSDHELEMIYISARKMADFAEGLMEACLIYFGEEGHIHRENLKPDGSEVRFLITKK